MAESRFSIAGLSSWLWSLWGPESEGLSQEEMPPALEGGNVVAIKPVPVPVPPAGTPRPLPNNITHVDFINRTRFEVPTRPVPWPIAVGAVVTGAMLSYRLDQDPYVILRREVIDPGFGLSTKDKLVQAAFDAVVLAKIQGDAQAVEAIKDGWVALAAQGIDSQSNFLEKVRDRYPEFSDKIHRLFFAEGKMEDSRYDLLHRLWLAAGWDEADARRNAEAGVLPEVSGLSKILPRELSIRFLPDSVSVYDPEFVAKERRISADTPTVAVDLDNTLYGDFHRLNAELVDLLISLQREENIRLILWTGASRQKVIKIMTEFPVLAQLFNLVITNKNYAPDPNAFLWGHLSREELRQLYDRFSPTPYRPFEEVSAEAMMHGLPWSSAVKEAGLLGYVALIDDAAVSRSHVRVSPFGKSVGIPPRCDEEWQRMSMSRIRDQILAAIGDWETSSNFR